MKKLFFALLVFFALSLTSNGQSMIAVQGGYDWLEGNVALAGQTGHWGGTVGTFFTKMPGSGDPITGFCWSVSWNDAPYYASGYYASIGMNSAGYRSEVSYNGGSWGSDIVVPMWIAMLGYRYGSDNLYLKAAAGYGWCDQASSFTYGISAGWAFGN